jgi:hypothetical protein
MCQHLRPILHEDQFDTGVKAHLTADDQTISHLPYLDLAGSPSRWSSVDGSLPAVLQHGRHRSTPHSELDDIQESPHDNPIGLPEQIHTQS